jgi:hypothetical protein
MLIHALVGLEIGGAILLLSASWRLGEYLVFSLDFFSSTIVCEHQRVRFATIHFREMTVI